jgi:toxin ParE1/3/4
MKARRVEFSAEATRDLVALYEWIAKAAGAATAASYMDRLEEYCRGFDVASERGQRRDDIRPGLRVVGYEKRVAIAFFVEDERVVLLRLFYGGQNWEATYE